MSKPYRVLHTEIGGMLEDRDRGYPDLVLELHPMGTENPPEEQIRELHVKIGGNKTVLDEGGITQLKEFLDMKP